MNSRLVSHRTLFTILAVLTATAPLKASSFFDTFNRPDASIVGNNWLPAANAFPLELHEHRLSVSRTYIGRGGIYRPHAFSGTTYIFITLTPGNGYGGLSSRFNHKIAIHNNGSYESGYALALVRSDRNYANSAIELWDNDRLLERIPSTFQFQDNVQCLFAFQTDGSIRLTLTEGSSRFEHVFIPRVIESDGNNVFLGMEYPDTRANPLNYPTYDDFYIGTSPPIHGQVISDDTKQPIAGVAVVLTSSQAAYKASSLTDADGYYIIVGYAFGDYIVPVSSGVSGSPNNHNPGAHGLAFTPPRANDATETKPLNFCAQSKPPKSLDSDIVTFRLPFAESARLSTEAGGYAAPPSGAVADADPFHTDSSPSGYYALDFSASVKEVLSARPGYAAQRNAPGFGPTVDIDHGDGFVSTYAHLENIPAYIPSTGNVHIPSGTRVGDVSSSPVGISTGPHLHFHLRYHNDGTSTNPQLARVRFSTAEGNLAMTEFVAGTTYTAIPQPEDVTSLLNISPGGFRLNRSTGNFAQVITIKNPSGLVIASPILLIFDELSANAALATPIVMSSVQQPNASQYIEIPTGADSALTPGEIITLPVEFRNAGNNRISYRIRVLSGTKNP